MKSKLIKIAIFTTAFLIPLPALAQVYNSTCDAAMDKLNLLIKRMPSGYKGEIDSSTSMEVDFGGQGFEKCEYGEWVSSRNIPEKYRDFVTKDYQLYLVPESIAETVPYNRHTSYGAYCGGRYYHLKGSMGYLDSIYDKTGEKYGLSDSAQASDKKVYCKKLDNNTYEETVIDTTYYKIDVNPNYRVSANYITKNVFMVKTKNPQF